MKIVKLNWLRKYVIFKRKFIIKSRFMFLRHSYDIWLYFKNQFKWWMFNFMQQYRFTWNVLNEDTLFKLSQFSVKMAIWRQKRFRETSVVSTWRKRSRNQFCCLKIVMTSYTAIRSYHKRWTKQDLFVFAVWSVEKVKSLIWTIIFNWSVEL